ncbi:MAG: hypothetical protein KAI79_01245, partial [Bacteroidales bacterium]|nr:hypothetical protein [Bacteroidales bacterium]
MNKSDIIKVFNNFPLFKNSISTIQIEKNDSGKDVLNGSINVSGSTMSFSAGTDLKTGITFINEISIDKIIPQVSSIEFLKDLKLTGVTLKSNLIMGSLKFKGEDTTLMCFSHGKDSKLSKTNLYVGLVHDKLKLSDYLPSAKKTVVDSVALDDVGLLLVLKGSPELKLKAKELPEPMGGIIQKALAEKDRDKELQLTHGLHFFGRLDVNASGKLKSLLKKLGTTEKSLPLRGDFDTALLARLKKGTQKISFKQKKKSGKQKEKEKKRKDLITKKGKKIKIGDFLKKRLVNIRVPIPKVKIPGIPNNLTIHKGEFVIRSFLDEFGKKRFESLFQGGMDFDMKGSSKKLSADVDITFEKVKEDGEFNFKMSAEATTKWSPPHVDWLELDDIRIDGEFGAAKGKGKHFDMTIEAISKVDNKDIELDIDFHIADKKIKDFLIRLDGEIPLKVIPKLKEIPVIKDLTIHDVVVSPSIVKGSLKFKGEDTTLMCFSHGKNSKLSKTNLYVGLVHDKLKLSDYLPSAKKTVVDSVALDDVGLL